MDGSEHPENSAEASMDLAAQERREEQNRTGGSFHPHSVFGMTASPGITLRDYFAAQLLANVMPGLASNQVTVGEIATTAYEVADAMLKARKVSR